MNKPSTPDDGDLIQPLNSASPIPSEPASCPFYTVIPTESVAITKFSYVDEKNQGEQEQVTQGFKMSADEELESIFTLDENYWEAKTSETEADLAEDTGDWLAEPDQAKQSAINSEFQQLLTLNQELREANDNLYQQVESLTSQLSESEKAFQLQRKRFNVTESILKEQAQELSATQDQIQSLYHQLDNSQQNVQRQETLIETYRAQLEFSQQRLAQLERECVSLQSHHQEQSQHLLHSENACKELRTRLMRQQRQTLQFKAALEKCLETSIPTEADENESQSHQNSHRSSHHLRKLKSLLANAQPIKPWSADEEETDTIGDIWNDSPSIAAPWQDKSSFDSHRENLSSHSLEEQIESVIQMFFNFPAEANPETSDKRENHQEVAFPEYPQNEKNEISTWDTIEIQSTNAIEPRSTNTIEPCSANANATPLESTISDNTITVDAKTSSSEEASLISPPANSIPADEYWQEISQLTQIETVSGEGQYLDHDDTGSPSPIVYPNRPTKKRNSLAAVELPKFKPQTRHPK